MWEPAPFLPAICPAGTSKSWAGIFPQAGGPQDYGVKGIAGSCHGKGLPQLLTRSCAPFALDQGCSGLWWGVGWAHSHPELGDGEMAQGTHSWQKSFPGPTFLSQIEQRVEPAKRAAHSVSKRLQACLQGQSGSEMDKRVVSGVLPPQLTLAPALSLPAKGTPGTCFVGFAKGWPKVQPRSRLQ